MNPKLEARNRFYSFFEDFAPRYSRYRSGRKYYWKSITNWCNYFIHEDDKVLEIGCGTGATLSQLKGSKRVGIDYSPAMIDAAKKENPDLEFHCMAADELDLDEKFDVIVLTNVVGVFANVQDVFETLHRVSHPQTRVLISYFNYFWQPLSSLGETLGFKKKMPVQNWLSNQDIANLLYLADFEAFKQAKGMLIPFNIPLISFICNRYLARLPLINRLCLNSFLVARPQPYTRSDVEEKYSSTIVIPARNEAGNIENAILRLPKFGKHQEIIFVEGNSTDNTWEVIQEISEKYKDSHDIKIARQDGKGKGDAVRKGYQMATGDILMILDADLTVPPEELPKFYHALASGKGEFINGSRMVYPLEQNSMRTLNIMGNKFFSMAFSWILERPIRDTLCGTKVMFRTDYLKLAKNRKFFGEFDPFGDFDLIFGAYKLNLKIIDLPIRYQERIYGDTNISRFRHGFILLKMSWYAMHKIKFW
ncbi:glycosyltransferase [bacterium SCSIO 12741]|nr:glycosyltransferase [bacterium SCSIO 12741]